MRLSELYKQADYKDNLGMLFNADCIDIMKKMDNECVDMILTDPPYGMNFQSGHRKDKYSKIKNDNTLDFLDDYFMQCERIMKDNTAIYCFCSWHNIDIFKQKIEKYFKLKNLIVWEKNNTSMGDLQGSYAPKHELILYAHKGRCLLNGKRYPDIVKYSRTGNKLHPTEKPVDMLEFFMNNSCCDNGIVFDGFAGSGSTFVACKNTGRRYIGCELDENYFNVAKERLSSE